MHQLDRAYSIDLELPEPFTNHMQRLSHANAMQRLSQVMQRSLLEDPLISLSIESQVEVRVVDALGLTACLQKTTISLPICPSLKEQRQKES